MLLNIEGVDDEEDQVEAMTNDDRQGSLKRGKVSENKCPPWDCAIFNLETVG